MMRSNFSSPVYGGGTLRSSVEGVSVALHRAFPLRLASLASSPVNGGGKPPVSG